MVRGLHFVFVFATKSFSDRSVAEGLQLPMAGWVKFFSPNLSPSTRMLPHTEFAIPPELLFCREPTRSLDVCVERMSTDRTDARYFLKFLGLWVLTTQLKELAAGRFLLRVRLVQKAILALYLRADSIVAQFVQVDLASALTEDFRSRNV